VRACIWPLQSPLLASLSPTTDRLPPTRRSAHPLLREAPPAALDGAPAVWLCLEGDSIVGHIAANLGEPLTGRVLRQAMAYGTSLASFNVEEFGTDRVERLTAAEVLGRVTELREMTHFVHDAAPSAA